MYPSTQKGVYSQCMYTMHHMLVLVKLRLYLLTPTLMSTVALAVLLVQVYTVIVFH